MAFLLGVLSSRASQSSLTIASSNDPTTLTIGLLLPKDEPQSLSLQQGVLLAVTEASKKAAPSVKVVIRGAVGQWGADGVEAARMVADDHATGLVAPPSGAGTHLALQVAGRTAVPVISLCPDSSVTRTGVPWTVRVCPRTIDDVLALLRGLNLKGQGRDPARWTVVIPPGRRGREIARDVARAAELEQAPLPVMIELPSPAPDLASFARPLAKNRSQMILIWLDPIPAASLVKSLRTLGFKGRLGGPGSLRCSEFIEATGQVLGEFKVPAPVLSTADRLRYERFSADYRARFGREPDYMATMSHDAASLLIHLLGMAGEKPAHEIFPIAFEFSGVTGLLCFDKEGNRQVQLQLVELHASRAELTTAQ